MKKNEDQNVYIKSISLHAFKEKPDGTSWNGVGNILFTEKTSFLANNILTKAVSVSLDNNDQYELCIMTSHSKTSTCKMFGPTPGLGLINYLWNLQSNMKIETLTIDPILGDGNFSIGHIKLHHPIK